MKSISRTAPVLPAYRAALASCILAGTLAVLNQVAMGQIEPKPPSGGLINPRAIVFSPATGKVYAVDTSHGAVTIYDDAHGTRHAVKVGAEPISVAVNAANGTAYVANGGDGTVSVLDGASDAVVATVEVGSHPYSIAVNAKTGKVYVTHTFGNELSILNGANNPASHLKTGSYDLIAIDDKTDTIYLLGYESGTVSVVDGEHQTVRLKQAGNHAWGLALDEQTGTLYAARIETAQVAALGADSSSPRYLPSGPIPCAITLNARADVLYVANYGDNSVSAVNLRNGHAIATVSVGERPKGIAYDASRNLVYVANTLGGSVTAIDAATNRVLATLPAGKNPYALAVVPGSSRLYVANEWDEQGSTAVDLSGIRVRRQ
jgi:YVTN family beta-propeller protein